MLKDCNSTGGSQKSENEQRGSFHRSVVESMGGGQALFVWLVDTLGEGVHGGPLSAKENMFFIVVF